MKNKKAIVVCTVACFLGFEINDIKILESLGYTIYVATNFDTYEYMHDTLREAGVSDRHQLQVDFTRSPFTAKVPESYFELMKILNKGHFLLMHCHTPVGGVIGRMAAKKYNSAQERKGEEPMKVIYTAHGFHFYYGAPKKNWLLYYPVEKALSKYTDVLITINKEDYHRAKKDFHARKTVYVPGVGVDTRRFESVSASIDSSVKREELGIEKNVILLLSIGELNVNKNHRAVIEALGKLQRTGKIDDTHIVYMIAGTGEKKSELGKLALAENVDVRFLGYRNDVSELLTAADLYILPSIREGLNVSLMEAMASGTPCLASDIRGNVDLIDPGKGGVLFNPTDVNSVMESIASEIETRDKWQQQGLYNQKKIRGFDLSVVETDYEKLIRGGV